MSVPSKEATVMKINKKIASLTELKYFINDFIWIQPLMIQNNYQ